MSKSSPITNRIQKALYMKSALKQADDVTKVNPEIYADTEDGRIVSGRVEDTAAEYGTKQIQATAKKTYSYDQLRADSIASGMSEEDADKAVSDAKAYNLATHGTHSPTAAGKTDNTYDVGKVDAEGNAVMIDDPSGEQVETKAAGKKFVAKDVPQDFAVHSQLSAGQAGRGNLKAINKAMRTEGKLGAFNQPKPTGQGFSSGDKWSKKDKRLYAAKLASGSDMGYGTGVGIAGQSYEKSKMVYQKNTGDVENQTYTNINDPKYKTSKKVTKDGISMKESPVKQLKGIFETIGKVAGKTVAKKRAVQKSLSDAGKSAVDSYKGAKKAGSDAFDAAAGNPKVVVKKPLTKAQYKAKGTVKGKGQFGVAGSDKGYNTYKAGFKTTKPSKNLSKAGGKPSGNILTRNPKKSIAGALGVAGVGYYATQGGGGDVPDVTPPPVIPPKPDVTPPKPDVTPPKVDPIKPPVTTGGGGDTGIKVTGATEGMLVDKPTTTTTPNVTGPGDALSSSMRRFNERQGKKKARVEGRQERKDIRQAGKLNRQANKVAAQTLAGKAKSFGGKKHDTNINNMGVVTTPGYNQKDKKKKGGAAGWGSTYSA